MKTNVTSLRHPKVLQAIRFALWLARLEAKKKAKQGNKWAKATQYVQNRKGNNFLRVDVSTSGELVIRGDQSIDVTGLVLSAVCLR